jgi:hypothetical protein
MLNPQDERVANVQTPHKEILSFLKKYFQQNELDTKFLNDFLESYYPNLLTHMRENVINTNEKVSDEVIFRFMCAITYVAITIGYLFFNIDPKDKKNLNEEKYHSLGTFSITDQYENFNLEKANINDETETSPMWDLVAMYFVVTDVDPNNYDKSLMNKVDTILMNDIIESMNPSIKIASYNVLSNSTLGTFANVCEINNKKRNELIVEKIVNMMKKNYIIALQDVDSELFNTIQQNGAEYNYKFAYLNHDTGVTGGVMIGSPYITSSSMVDLVLESTILESSVIPDQESKKSSFVKIGKNFNFNLLVCTLTFDNKDITVMTHKEKPKDLIKNNKFYGYACGIEGSVLFTSDIDPSKIESTYLKLLTDPKIKTTYSNRFNDINGIYRYY